MLYICKYCYHKAKESIEKQKLLEIITFFVFQDVLLTFLFYNIIRNKALQCISILLLLERTSTEVRAQSS